MGKIMAKSGIMGKIMAKMGKKSRVDSEL